MYLILNHEFFFVKSQWKRVEVEMTYLINWYFILVKQINKNQTNKKYNSRGAWVAQSGERLSLGFGL